MKLLSGIVLVSLALTVPARAEDANASKQFLQDFAFFCAASPGRPDKTTAAARVANLRAVEPDVLTALGPQTSPDEMQGWYLRDNGTSKTLLAVSETEIDGEPNATCTVFSTSALGTEVAIELASMIELQDPVVDQSSFGNRMRLWHTDIIDQPIKLILGNPSDDKIPGVTLGILAKLAVP